MTQSDESHTAARHLKSISQGRQAGRDLSVLALANEITIASERRLDSRHSWCPECNL